MTFMEFDSLEAAQQWMADQTDRANEATSDRQKAITGGDHWVRLDYPEFEIWGRVWTEEEFVASEKAAGATRAELRYSLQVLRDSAERGYRFGIAYSTVEPGGELGDTHVYNMLPVPASLFEAARDCGWDLNLRGFQDFCTTLGLTTSAPPSVRSKVLGEWVAQVRALQMTEGDR